MTYVEHEIGINDPSCTVFGSVGRDNFMDAFIEESEWYAGSRAELDRQVAITPNDNWASFDYTLDGTPASFPYGEPFISKHDDQIGILAYEYFHGPQFSRIGDLPRGPNWLHEGAAEYVAARTREQAHEWGWKVYAEYRSGRRVQAVESDVPLRSFEIQGDGYSGEFLYSSWIPCHRVPGSSSRRHIGVVAVL